MKPMALIVAYLLVAVATAQAQHRAPGNPNDLVREDESGPPVAGGSGATVGPNYKNQAVTPMPSREQLDERRPSEADLPPPDIRPVTRPAPTGQR